MSDDCALTGTLQAGQGSITVTINGGGHSITGGAFILFLGADMVLNLNSVTIDGGSQARTETLLVDTLNANGVTFIRSRSGPAVNATNSNLTNVLLDSNFSSSYALGGNGSAVHAGVNTTHVWENVVLRRNFGNGGAISLKTGATLTTSGCLTLSGNTPYDVYDPQIAWTDNSTGSCSGTIGNGDQAVIPAPARMACGLPEPGVLDASATYTLRSDCQLDGVIIISEDVSIHIIGNGNTIGSSLGIYHFRTAATSSLRLENVELNGVRIFNWGDLRADRLRMADTIGGIIFNLGEARFVNSLFEDNTTYAANSRSVLLTWSAYQKGFTSFTDSAFRNNNGGLGVLQNAGATIEFNGCVLFEDNSPADYSGSITDNQDPDCDAEIVNPVIPIAVPSPPKRSKPKTQQTPHNWHSRPSDCDIPLGAIGLICRPRKQPPNLEVWRVIEKSEGVFVLRVNQKQIEAASEGLIACSEDGRVAVRVGLPVAVYQQIIHSKRYQEVRPSSNARDIVVSKGPTDEGKVHHVVFDNSLDGHVLGTVDTFDGPPCSPASPEPASAGSQEPGTPKHEARRGAKRQGNRIKTKMCCNIN
ncbi:MAG: hypothetical protein OXN94_16935 [Chloroflexota bacterium]|nr:hypothetical protein [Chloroflexota bacterium]